MRPSPPVGAILVSFHGRAGAPTEKKRKRMPALTTQQAAERLGVTRRRVLALIKTGQLPARAEVLGGRAEWRIEERDLKLVQMQPTGRRGPKK